MRRNYIAPDGRRLRLDFRRLGGVAGSDFFYATAQLVQALSWNKCVLTNTIIIKSRKL